ncbi:putative protein kinase [Leptomonas pyrrhocoris]|uniref:Protein kinase domain-containing protein n=1 Tax=Leptomonas pyrrhocoris TaxID=157538 RepID=A0A0N0DRS2_LEPPY|nr:putative protein kinase [Leptomonas pyrrhocoris]XP_015653354.1 putative protein kinase [Leptomonas pyrrhocoris]KPA74914.1 putative protein kinase [Leptomonas pyrrhocoris]KPA74915.1 putative protein kinase [Leptomonas pyrrhocoris]|eukprot:XP_015653353.1 putative protein kinase [Leptomonas pyrrhocoris]
MSKPDWMNFEDSANGAVVQPTTDTAATADTVASLAGHNDAADSRSALHGVGEEDLPLFLRDDATAFHVPPDGTASSGTPAFLSDMSRHHTDAQAGEGESEMDGGKNTRRVGAGGGAGSGALRRPGTADDKSVSSSTVMYADQPSAALLHFTGDSGDAWSLHRVRILGKGNYGCATLYSLDEETAGSSPSSSSASSPSPRRSVVVKDINVQTMLNPREDMSAVQNELRVLRSVAGHPNLVQYVDALFDARPENYPMCFILMEYAAGGDLAALMERCSTTAAAAASSPTTTANTTAIASFASDLLRHGGDGGTTMISEDHVAAYLIQTAVALHSLHTEYGVLHRDVKPHNIFLLEDGVTVRLGDFGISMQLGRVGEKAKEACGSPYFMAPEIFEEKPYDAAADVWSLGVVFYQLLTRQLPFVAASVAALGPLVRRGQFARLSDASSEAAAAVSAAAYSKELRELVDSLLTVEPAARPTLRRVLRSRYVRDHLRCVPLSVLQAKRPVVARATGPAVLPRDGAAGTGTGTATVAPQFTEESLYASVFGAEAVAAAVAHASFAGVSPIVSRTSHP